MAAPSGIVWGSIINSKGRIGIYTSLSSTDTETTVSIEVWFYSKWSVDDGNNSYYFNDNASSATTKIGSVNINHTVATGSGWDVSNQTKLGSYTKTYSRGTSAKTIYCAAKLTNVEAVNGTMSVSTSYVIPALKSYTVSYNANGGTGAPSSQTKWHGTNIYLSTTTPTRTGYTFLGWSTSSAATSVTHKSGAAFGLNANTVLYAVWRANTFTVTYNANGGVNAPSSQTKSYGSTLTLSTATPTRADYRFVGWGTSANSTTVSYSPGGSYTSNSNVTLYAIWESAYTKPRITNPTVKRCNSAGTAQEDGTYFNVSFSWATDYTVASIKVRWTDNTTQQTYTKTISASGQNGNVSSVFGDNLMSAERSYPITIYVSDSGGETSTMVTLPSASYPIDFRKGGKGVAIGMVSDEDNKLKVKWETDFKGPVNIDEELYVIGEAMFSSGISAGYASFYEFKALDTMEDKYGIEMTNGLAIYTTEGIDPDSTLDHLILTHIKTPNGGYMYIKTEFYGNKTVSSNRMQTAFPYRQSAEAYFRYFYNGSWGNWISFKPAITYSTTERLTGDTWIDGKAVYQRVLTFSMNSTDELLTTGSSIANFGTLLKIDGYVMRSTKDKYFPLTFFYSTSNYHTVCVDTSGNIMAKTSSPITGTVIVEYTKTT